MWVKKEDYDDLKENVDRSKDVIRQLEKELREYRNKYYAEKFKGLPELPQRYSCFYCRTSGFKRNMKKFKNSNVEGDTGVAYVCKECLKK